LLNHSYRVGVHLGVTGDDVALGAMPFCGVMGYNAFLSALTHGIPLVVQRAFDPEAAVDLIQAHDVTYFSAIGEMYVRLVDALESDGTDSSDALASLERGAVAFVGGFDEDAFERVERVADFPLVRPYGLSEANSQVFVGDPSDPFEQRARLGGPLVFPEAEDARIVDPETGEAAAVGDRGEIQLRGFNVMDGYLNSPEANAETFTADGWLRTGDLGSVDEQGYYYFHARLDDAMRIRGFLVSPGEIEAVVDEHPAVDRSQVVGVPHPAHGQTAFAFVKPAVSDPDAGDVEAFLADRIADYKLPEGVAFVDEFPRTEGPHGSKVQKAELRKRATELVDR
jgi:fatty-acyl-CoA synthase